MNFRIPAARLALALCIALSGSALALAKDTDTTEIEVINNGVSEKIALASLKIGETRQVHSETGTLVTVTRLAESIELDIGGEKTSVPMIEPGEMSHEELVALGDEGHGGKRRVIRLHHGQGGADAKADGEPRVIVIDAAGHGGHRLEGDGPHVVVDKSGEGKQVIVKRRVTRDDAQ